MKRAQEDFSLLTQTLPTDLRISIFVGRKDLRSLGRTYLDSENFSFFFFEYFFGYQNLASWARHGPRFGPGLAQACLVSNWLGLAWLGIGSALSLSVSVLSAATSAATGAGAHPIPRR